MNINKEEKLLTNRAEGIAAKLIALQSPALSQDKLLILANYAHTSTVLSCLDETLFQQALFKEKEYFVNQLAYLI